MFLTDEGEVINDKVNVVQAIKYLFKPLVNGIGGPPGAAGPSLLAL